jgi:hypothetical protein
MNIDSNFIFYISFSDNPEALINAVFLNNCAYFGLRGRQDHVNMYIQTQKTKYIFITFFEMHFYLYEYIIRIFYFHEFKSDCTKKRKKKNTTKHIIYFPLLF